MDIECVDGGDFENPAAQELSEIFGGSGNTNIADKGSFRGKIIRLIVEPICFPLAYLLKIRIGSSFGVRLEFSDFVQGVSMNVAKVLLDFAIQVALICLVYFVLNYFFKELSNTIITVISVAFSILLYKLVLLPFLKIKQS